MNNIFQTYKKAKKVIASCDSFLQFRSAKKYTALWFKQNSTYHPLTDTYSADSLQQELYAKLLSLQYLKKYELKDKI
jgi:hypothetical protein